MKVDNARRLTGRGFFLTGPGVTVELRFEPGDDRAAIEVGWPAILTSILDVVGMPEAVRYTHFFEGGFTTSIKGPIDRLLAMADLIEWGALSLAGATEVTFVEAVAAYEAALVEQASAALLALESAAHARGVPFLWDDDAVSLGLGVHAETFEPRVLPTEVAWERYGAIPVGLVTGTNGKTTTTRMIAKILAAAGHLTGMSSTDAIVVDGAIVETGDWTGPGAARRVLRDARVTAAALETARGGILRRGLAYEWADAAVVTNIGEDHFGDYGICSMADMARVKAVVWDGVRPGGKRVANAGCAVSMAHLQAAGQGVVGGLDWVLFGRDEAVIATHLAGGAEAWTIRDGHLTHHVGTRAHAIIACDDIPATFAGHAAHNLDNALAAAATAHAMGCDDEAIARGLATFSARDNPGRLEHYTVRGVHVLLDFAHNPHGVRALAAVIGHVRGAGRLLVVTGQAGDRSEHDLAELARATLELRPDRVLVRPMRGYERGREPGEVEGILASAFARQGFDASAFGVTDGEVAALEAGMASMVPGDLIAVLVHIEREEVHAWLDLQANSE